MSKIINFPGMSRSQYYQTVPLSDEQTQFIRRWCRLTQMEMERSLDCLELAESLEHDIAASARRGTPGARSLQALHNEGRFDDILEEEALLK